MKVIGVRFQSSGRIYYFDPLEYTLSEGDGVIVETARGQEYGEVAQGITEVEDTAIVSPLKPVVRPATEQDFTMREQNAAKEEDAFHICQKKIERHGLDMRLVRAEYSFNGSKLVFYFTADERVDFRELVKDLASQFRTRIELRQIGVRDEAKMIGGLGACGRAVCCKSFLEDFHPVSIKMAKEQNLSLSPTKISGLCGRLMCCLQYEQSSYEEMKKKMPRVNREVLTPDGVGTVVENNVITERTKVRICMPDGTIDVKDYHYTAIGRVGEPLPVPQIPEKPAPEKAPDPWAYESAGDEGPRPEQAHSAQGAENGPQAAAGADAPERAADKKRRRRGGRGRGGNRPEGERPQGGDAQRVEGVRQNASPTAGSRSNGPRSEGPQPAGSRPAGPRPKGPGPAGPGPAGPRTERQEGGATEEGTKAKSARRHKRGGANRPHAEQKTTPKPE